MAPEMKTKPIDDAEMAHLMAALGPFEKNPHIAVAVSGGADSMALTLLADAWAQQQGGKVTALSVDHGLRPAAAGEAQQVGHWLAARGIDHRVLRWTGEKPKAGLQAAARAARFDLLAQWCRSAGVLHLLLAHHIEDQAETFLLRLNRDSGIDGLAAMASIVEKADMRLLRPLLGVAKARLCATLNAAAQPWLEDPSNENRAFERVRIRKTFPDLAAAGITAQGLAETARRMARARIAFEAAASELLALCCTVDPTGYAHINGAGLFSGPEEISLRALSRTLMCIGGDDYPPRLKKLEHLHEKMKAACREGTTGWKGATLGRCRILALANTKGGTGFLICRESRFLPAPMSVQTAMDYDWDRRFLLRFQGEKIIPYQHVSLQALGDKGWSILVAKVPEIRKINMPAQVRATLPALLDADGIIAVPHLNYCRVPMDRPAPAFSRAVFHPRQSLSGTGFLVAQ